MKLVAQSRKPSSAPAPLLATRGFAEHASDDAHKVSPPLQRALSAGHRFTAPPEGRRALPGGLPERLRAGVEALSGLPMDDVRVHLNSPHPASVDAAAYTQGNHIHVARGQEHFLPHEAWHVVQQKQRRVRSTVQVAGMPVNDSHTLEQEAERMGSRAAQVSQAPARATDAASQPVAS